VQGTSNCEKLKTVYRQLDEAKYKLDEIIENEKKEMQDTEGDILDKVEGARAWVEDGVLRVTVDEVLPRTRTGYRNQRRFWVSKIVSALSEINIKFSQALCIIAIYSPVKKNWDTDNRAYSYIINAVRLSHIIEDDNSKYLTFMVVGQIDFEYPRTEIYLLEQPLDPQLIVSKLKVGS